MTKSTRGESLIYLEQTMDRPEVHDLAGGRVGVFSTVSPDKDRPNEDAAAVIPIDERSAVFVVADGLGGTRQGREASRLAIESLESALREAALNGEDLQPAILGGIERANHEILSLTTDAATTIAVAELHDDEVRPYHVGDSPVLVFGQRGKMKLQTVCHSPVGFAVEAGMLDEEEAMYHEARHLVSNVIGASDMRIEVGLPLKLDARDTLLLASDGLMDNLHVEEVVDRLRTGPILEAVATLAHQSLDRMIRPMLGQPSKPDDITFIAFRKN